MKALFLAKRILKVIAFEREWNKENVFVTTTEQRKRTLRSNMKS